MPLTPEQLAARQKIIQGNVESLGLRRSGIDNAAPVTSVKTVYPPQTAAPTPASPFPVQEKDSMTQKMERAYPKPSPVSSGMNLYTRDANGNYVNAPNLLYGDQNIASNRAAGELGLQEGQYYGDSQAELKAGLAANQRETAFATSQMAGQDTLEKNAMQRANEGSASSAEAFTGNLAQGREGVMSFGNQALIGQNTERVRGIIADREAAYKLAVENRANITARLAEAQRSNNTAAVKQLSQQLASAESNIAQQEQQALDQANKDRVFALQFNEDSRAQRTMAFNQGMATLGTLLENGVQISPAMSVKLAQQMGVDTADVIAYNDAISRIDKDKTLDQAGKQMAIQSARIDLQRKKENRDDQALNRLAILEGMYRSGASQDEISRFKSATGMTDYEDPMTQAKLKMAQSQALVAQYESGEADPPRGTPQWYALQKARLDVEEQRSRVNDLEGGSGDGWTWTPGTTGMRTDRNNNPIASKMYAPTVRLLEQAGLVKGLDFDPVGDSTAGVDSDSVGTVKFSTPEAGVRGAIAVLEGGQIASWYANDKYGGSARIRNMIADASGQRVTSAKQAQEAFNSLDTAQQTKIVADIYKHEGGRGKFDKTSLSGVGGKNTGFGSIANTAFDFINSTASEKTKILQGLPESKRTILRELDNMNYSSVLGSDAKYADGVTQFMTGKSKTERASRGLEMAEKIASNDTEGVSSLLLTSFNEALDTETKKNYSGYNTLLKQLDAINTMLGEVERTGETGFVSGNLEKYAQKVGNSTNPETAALGSRILSTIVDFRRAVSGAAFTESEAKAYESLFPGITKGKELNTALLKQIRATTETKRDSLVDTYSGGQFSTWNELKNPKLSTEGSKRSDPGLDAWYTTASSEKDSFLNNLP